MVFCYVCDSIDSDKIPNSISKNAAPNHVKASTLATYSCTHSPYLLHKNDSVNQKCSNLVSSLHLTC